MLNGEPLELIGRRRQKVGRVLIVDHYDSFTYNITNLLYSHDIQSEVLAFDRLPASARILQDYCGVVLSAGPRSPSEVGPSCRLVAELVGVMPVFGICLGFQILGIQYGADLERSSSPRHGMTRSITVVKESKLFGHGKFSFRAAAYNSLRIVTEQRFQGHVLARCNDGEIQAIEVPGRFPAWGVQYHPESFLSEQSSIVVAAFREELRRFQEFKSQ